MSAEIAVLPEKRILTLNAVMMAHLVLSATLEPGDAVVDATVGNGQDALFLARKVGRGGTVHCFDIQAAALKSARARVVESDVLATVRFYRQSHDRMEEVLTTERRGTMRAVMFNLGYLPGGDKSIITRSETTIPALEQALNLLMDGGLLSVVLYSGHAGGAGEKHAVETWARSLDASRYHASHFRALNQDDAPALLLVQKRYINGSAN